MTIKVEQETELRIVEAKPSRMPFAVAGLAAGEHAPIRSLRVFRAEAEAHAIRRALEFAAWNRSRAAKLLCISYRGLLYKIRQYNITASSRDEGVVEGQPNVQK